MIKNKTNTYLLATLILVAFMVLGYTVKFYPETLTAFDQPVAHFLQQTITQTKTETFKTITFFGNVATISILLLLITILLILFKRYSEAIWLVFNTAIGSGLGNYLVKFLYHRPRPLTEHLVPADHYSFPSGHAMASILFYGSLIIVIQLIMSASSFKKIIQSLLVILILLIGWSRIYLNVHYPTDIIGGYLLGSAWLIATLPIFTKIRFIWRFKNKQN
ncbi:phosphatase PAP2 family protein [Vagococcus coleopterorum]|uniref:Phosphatase PAP2 family protein n=1 Tax=Vagococcus coleopterorum TaxID=2714946 RepID=A0A6G8AM74_9ENTE|nr:phosphatase PAP2 family protein [Vagococcus coleopterorum]QIL46059.1 phosphatase PAP2 family protein [Vagococcus coleopterorum]